MNIEKLKAMENTVMIGGKGCARRKKKIIHKSQGQDDKRLQGAMKKINCNPIPGIEEVNIIKHDCTVINFKNPKVQASVGSNTFIISGFDVTEMMPEIIPQLGPDMISNLKHIMGDYKPPMEDEIPELVGDFDDTEDSGEATPGPSKIESIPEN